MSLRTTIILALVIAVAAYAIPYATMQGSPRYAFDCAVTLSMIWLSLAMYAVTRFRLRGLWVLVGVVPALYWTYFIVAVSFCASRVCL